MIGAVTKMELLQIWGKMSSKQNGLCITLRVLGGFIVGASTCVDVSSTKDGCNPILEGYFVDNKINTVETTK